MLLFQAFYRVERRFRSKVLKVSFYPQEKQMGNSPHLFFHIHFNPSSHYVVIFLNACLAIIQTSKSLSCKKVSISGINLESL